MRVFQATHDPLASVRTGLGAEAGAREVMVGIVDGLPDLAHPSLSAAAIDILQTMIPPDAARPDQHGTGVCSLIFGQNEEVRGIAPACSGLVLPIFFGRGPDETVRYASQLDLARAITFAIENGASIINVSAGQKTFTAEAETHLEQAIARCAEHRILIVALPETTAAIAFTCRLRCRAFSLSAHQTRRDARCRPAIGAPCIAAMASWHPARTSRSPRPAAASHRRQGQAMRRPSSQASPPCCSPSPAPRDMPSTPSMSGKS